MNVLEFPKIPYLGLEKRVLIVDDVEGFRAYLRLKISGTFPGIQITEAQSGIVASVELRKNDFDVVISDLRMPDGDGLWLHYFMEQYYTQVPLLFFTSSTESVPQTVHRKIFAKEEVRELLSELKDRWSANEAH
ncbi:MAG: response regulator [Bdellovibrionaceae bacterium]|nr:response regulator [Pseudobdellovibrionaceae bacterium]